MSEKQGKLYTIPGTKAKQNVFSMEQLQNIKTDLKLDFTLMKDKEGKLYKDPNNRYNLTWGGRYGLGLGGLLFVSPNTPSEDGRRGGMYNPNLGGTGRDKFLKRTQDLIDKMIKKNKRVGAGTKSDSGIIELDTGPKLVKNLIDKPLYEDD
jgi:hypothetical protein